MKTSVLDFIDSDTLRDHLRNQTLEPAIECIMITHSIKSSIEKKLEALKERYDTYSAEDFKLGTYYCRENDFKYALKEHINTTEKVLADMYRSDDNYVYNVRNIETLFDQVTFTTFEAAIDEIKQNHTGSQFIIAKTRINEFANDDIKAFLNEQGVIYDVMWTSFKGSIDMSLYGSYAWIPHRYVAGDIVVPTCYNTFAVVVEDNKRPLTTSGLNNNNISVRCMQFAEDNLHSCGGQFVQHNLSLFEIEYCKKSEMNECPKELIRFSQFIKGWISAAEFLEEYSKGKIN
ncbi:MAG: hypothetical protein J6Y71_01165 [Ruminococcus sp.]|nr:hypothetical protein [Ruminococcus sp.]